MPELPEVETLKQDLCRCVIGRTITSAWVSPEAAQIVRMPSVTAFCDGVAGGRIDDVHRRGKYLLICLDDKGYLIVHRRMTGNLILRPKDAPPDAYTRAVFALDDGTELRFTDVRKFGMMWLVAHPDEVLKGLGPEPLHWHFTSESLESRLAGRKGPIKAALMDQRVLAGMGNLYTDEALFLAGIDPRRTAGALSHDEAERLHRGIVQALHAGLQGKGASLRDHVNLDGTPGVAQEGVQVYRRTGEPCFRCQTPVEKVKLAGRSAHFCPVCQPLHAEAA